MQGPTLDDFSGRIGESFELAAGDERLPVVLEVAEELPNPVREGGAFRLEWRGPRDPVLPQAVYGFRRDDEAFEMFIVPVGRDEQGVVYEAVFA
jgi:hypothetical protein